MEVTRTDKCLYYGMKEGVNTFGVYLSPEADFDDAELNDALQKWSDGEDVYLNFLFSVRECIETMIEFHKHDSCDGIVMGEDDRPMVEAMRKELLEMADTLDQVRFAP